MKKRIELINVWVLNGLILLICLIALDIPKFYPNAVRKAHIYRTCTSHEAAISQAVKDIDSGKKYILLRGLLAMDEAEWQRMQEEERTFGFKYVSLGCMGGDRYTYTYDQIMRRTINDIAKKPMLRTFDSYNLKTAKKQPRY